MSPRTFIALFIVTITPACAPSAVRAPSPEPTLAPSTGASVPLRDCPTPPDLGVLLVGRHDGCDPSGVRTGWSGSGLVARFAGTGLQLRHAGPAVQYTVLIDGGLRPNLLTEPGSKTYPLASGLAPGEHELALYRRGEASFGAAVIQGLEVAGGALLPPPPPREPSSGAPTSATSSAPSRTPRSSPPPWPKWTSWTIYGPPSGPPSPVRP